MAFGSNYADAEVPSHANAHCRVGVILLPTTSDLKTMAASMNAVTGEKSYFEQQRELLIGDIANVRLPVLCKFYFLANTTTEPRERASEHQQAQSRA